MVDLHMPAIGDKMYKHELVGAYLSGLGTCGKVVVAGNWNQWLAALKQQPTQDMRAFWMRHRLVGVGNLVVADASGAKEVSRCCGHPERSQTEAELRPTTGKSMRTIRPQRVRYRCVHSWIAVAPPSVPDPETAIRVLGIRQFLQQKFLQSLSPLDRVHLPHSQRSLQTLQAVQPLSGVVEMRKVYRACAGK